MSELGDKLGSIFNDPGQLERITQMAKSIMGGEAQQGHKPESDPYSDIIDPSMLQKLAGIMGGKSSKSNKQALLEAMKPYLSDKRQRKMEKAMKLAKLASFAELAVEEFGADDD